MDNERNPYFKLQLRGQPQQPKLKLNKSPAKTDNAHRSPTLTVRKFNKPVAVDANKIQYTNGRGNNVLMYDGHRYIKNNCYGGKMYWKCSKWHTNCKARAITSVSNPEQCVLKNAHNHDVPREDMASCEISVVDANWYPLRMGGDSTHGSFRAPKFTYKQSQRSGRQLLVVNGIHFFRNRERNGKQYWKCNQYYKCKCPCIVLINTATSQLSIKHNHNHATTTGTAEEESVMQGRSRTGYQTGSSSVRSFPGRLLNGGGGNKTTNRRATTIPSDGRRVDRYESLSVEALGSASSSSHEGNAADGHY
uniref:FLYWCH-type domain-containing protein n=1 Tax=Anopheles melas TaxID=34690 RepID=A0A182TVV6_9DIPT